MISLLLSPLRDNTYYNLASNILFSLVPRLLSRPENWLPEEHARVQIWDNVLSKCENDTSLASVYRTLSKYVKLHVMIQKC